jgi:membrane-associated phospholipid phosphatase
VLFIYLGKKLLETGVVNLLAYSFFGCALALLLIYIGFFAKLKTSLHATSISGLIGFICILSFEYKLNLLVFLVFLFLVFGIISISRLKLEAHNNSEIYFGFLIGFISQLAVYSYFSYNI